MDNVFLFIYTGGQRIGMIIKRGEMSIELQAVSVRQDFMAEKLDKA